MVISNSNVGNIWMHMDAKSIQFKSMREADIMLNEIFVTLDKSENIFNAFNIQGKYC